MLRRFALLTIALTLVMVSFSQAGAAVFDRAVPAKGQVLDAQTTAPTGRIVVKFTEESLLEVAEHGLVGGDDATLARVQRLVGDVAKGRGLQRHFRASMEQIEADRQAGEARVRRSLPNLNAYGVMDFTHLQNSRKELLQILKRVLADPAVETAFLEPRAVPAALGFDAFTGTYTAPPRTVEDEAGTAVKSSDSRNTPDFSAQQGYLGAAPEGVNALAVNDVPGARGAGLHIVDIEGAWVWDHEDLPDPFYNPGAMHPDQSWRDHGTAVLGEIRGSDNGFGVRGITPEVEIGGISIQSYSVSSAINNAWRAVNPGDAVVIELHAPGPNANGQGQTGYVPMEYWQDNFDAILVASANGRIVCEAAGNGSENLDAEVYGDLFDREVRDSGAIMCGAANRFGTPEWFTNHGTRLDLNGWGSNVTTLAYGDLQGPPDHPETEFYTSGFSGTSSATPIVTGAVLALQGIVKEGTGTTLDAILMREILSQTGSPAGGTWIIGPRPDLLAAWAETQVGFGTVSGTVIDAASGLPVPGAVIKPLGVDYEIVAGEDGTFSFGLPAGPASLEVSDFFHVTETVAIDVIGGEVLDLEIDLTALPTVDVVGHVSSQTGADLAGVRATILDAPLDAGAISPQGLFTIPGAPDGRDFRILIDGSPLHGVDLIPVAPVAGVRSEQHVYCQLPEVENDFELWWEGLSDPLEIWTWGTPVGGPMSGFASEDCWGVGMAGNGYPDNTFTHLFLPRYNFYGSEQVLFSFHYYSELEDGMDGVKLQILDGNTWTDLAPLNDYSHERIQILNAAPAWSGDSQGWRGAVFDLTAYTENYIDMRFFFGSDGSVGDGGFYLDNLAFDFGDNLSGVTPLPEAAAFAPRVAAYPNPFNPQTEIAWEIAQAGKLTIEVFDARGHKVRVLHDGPVSETSGRQVFDGRDDHGARLASGMYLVQVRDGSDRRQTRRISLVK